MSVWAEQFDRALGMLVRDLERPYEAALDVELSRRIRHLGLTLGMYELLDKMDRLTGSPISESTCESGEPSPAELDRMAEVLHDTVYRMGARWAELHGDRRVEWREAMRAALRAGRPNEAAVEAAGWADLKRGQEEHDER